MVTWKTTFLDKHVVFHFHLSESECRVVVYVRISEDRTRKWTWSEHHLAMVGRKKALRGLAIHKMDGSLELGFVLMRAIGLTVRSGLAVPRHLEKKKDSSHKNRGCHPNAGHCFPLAHLIRLEAPHCSSPAPRPLAQTARA